MLSSLKNIWKKAYIRSFCTVRLYRKPKEPDRPEAYLDNAMISLYVNLVNLGSQEDQSDYLWTQILRFYFEISDNYGIERESYKDKKSRARTNMVLTNIRGGEIKKVIFMECKRPIPSEPMQQSASGPQRDPN